MLRRLPIALLLLVGCDRAEPPPAEASGTASAPSAVAPTPQAAERGGPEPGGPEPQPPPPTVTPDPPAGESGDAPAPEPKAPAGTGSSKRSGDGCRDSSECGTGGTCVGDGLEGCGGEPGRCERDVVCTRDAQPYCGCDGITFRSSGSCPGREFAHRGECRAGEPKADGASCLDGSDCASGICEGQGCGPNKAGRCMPKDRACTTDAVVYCGCDNVTFRSSSKCAGRRYRNLGDCHR